MAAPGQGVGPPIVTYGGGGEVVAGGFLEQLVMERAQSTGMLSCWFHGGCAGEWLDCTISIWPVA